MSVRRILNVLVSLTVLATLFLGSTSGAAAMPAAAVDPTKVPHYFGPYPNWANSPYSLPDATVTITGDGNGATAVAAVGAAGAITAITVTNPGSGYSNAKVSITGSGTGAAADAVIVRKGSVVSIAVNTPGSGYTAPVVSITGNGTGAAATAYGGVDAVSIVPGQGGSGYIFPTVDFDLPDAPDGVQAKGHVVMDASGSITDVIVDDPGSGYSSAPGVTIRDGTVFDPINNGGSGASAAATLAIQNVVVNSFGSNYTSVTVAITDPTGSGATATAKLDNGTITRITISKRGSGYITPGGIHKFVDTLPGLGPTAANNLGQYMPVAVPDTTTFPGTDYYVIAVVQHREKMHSDLPPTLLREYVQLETAQVSGAHVALQNDGLLPGTFTPISLPNGAGPAYGVDNPHFLGPVIVAQRDRAVRIVFYNLLPTGSGGDFFLPTDSTVMGSGMGPMSMMAPMDQGSVADEVRNPACSAYPKPEGCFKDNRATLHLHGGVTPWISDGTPHQWITPANESTPWPQGVSVQNVPDMVGASKPAGVPDCSLPNSGCETFYYTNQQSARLMFYHDHSWGITRLNVYAGEAAGYLISDPVEQSLVSKGVIPSDQIPLIIQDRTFVPQATQLAAQDPTWDAARWGSYGNLWYHHVYMPAQNPGDPSGMSAFGRWMYGPWFWPPAKDAKYGPIANPYYDPNCNLDNPATWQYQTDPFCEPAQIPGTPNISVGMEQFNDTPVVNGTAYPTTTLQPKSYRLRILNAANDRFWNLQWYVADSTGTEVALKAAELAAAQTDPNVYPTPDTALSPAGPSWIQIGTEGGFLPAPAVIPNQPITWITDPTRFDFGNVDKHSLLLAPAERADVIVDFSKFAGKTLILYNDAPAAFPARVASYDYYTGGPDLSPMGAPTTLPGYGPNTRTIMQVKIANTAAAAAFNLSGLQAAFRHHADGSGVFESGQHPIIVGQAAYNSAYGTSFASSGYCSTPNSTGKCDGFARISQQGGDPFTFNTLKGSKLSINLEPKALHDEMNAASFDEFGRMTANLGLEAVPATPGAQNILLYPYVASPTEIIDGTNLPKGDINVTPISTADGTQIWKITHNGVDTHPIHFHLYDVQVLNRVTWDNIIMPPDANELGWKDTVRISPLEDTIVALRPIIPSLPFDIPNSVRELSPMMPDGADLALGQIFDPQGNPVATLTNHLVNFGWEYVYHCHILSHEEMDMMRPVLLAVPPVPPSGLSLNAGTLTWTDSSLSETAFALEKSTDGGSTWSSVGRVDRVLVDPNTSGGTVSLTDSGWVDGDLYRVFAENTVGDLGAGGFPTVTVKSAYTYVGGLSIPAAPSQLTGSLAAGPVVNLSWTEDPNSTVSNFVIERSTNGGAFSTLATVPATPMSFTDVTATPSFTYTYRVSAANLAGTSAPSNLVSVAVITPTAPSNLAAALISATQVDLTWKDNATTELGFVVERSADGGATFAPLAPAPAANATSFQDITAIQGSTYVYQVRALNLAGISAPSNAVTILVDAPAAPGPLSATLQSNGFVALSWADLSNNESGFFVERSDNGGAFSPLTALPANSTSYVDNTVTAGHTYVYQVYAKNDIGPSPMSVSGPVAVPLITVPAAPSNLSANSTTRTSLTLRWRDNSNNEDGFTVQVSTSSSFATVLQTLAAPANATSINITGLTRNTRYYFRVLAFNVAGNSPWSPTFNTRTAN